jgi:2,4-dienoyl-CoA reductase-like NADH-dependent reductase (Old Yellow Enzyme family)
MPRRVFDQTPSSGELDLGPLLEPLPLAGTTLPNRVMTSAMTMQYGEDGLISDRHLALYEERARGGVGLMFSEQLTASPLSPSPFASEIRAYEERQVERFAALAERLAPYDSRFFAQLFCGGVVGSSTAGLAGWEPVRGPSRIGMPGGEPALPLSAGEIAQIAADFAKSAAGIKAGGLDGVEIHGAHGWLVGQFLSPYYNRREDSYGGSVENRCRFALEIGAAVRAAVGADFPLGIALSYDEVIGADGITEEDALAQLEVFLAAGTFDFFDFSIGSSHSEHFTIAPMAVAEGFALDFSRRAKELAGGRAAVFVAGRVVEPAMAAAAIAGGAADVVAMSRAHLADPHIVRKLREGRAGEVRRCMGANVCVGRALHGEPVACVLSPATGREVEGAVHWPRREVAAAEAKRVLVVGAGPAGLRAGAIAAARGHEVTVHERRAWPGGHLGEIAWLPTREGWAVAVEDLVAELERAGGELRLASEVDRALAEEVGPDLVILATGAEWARSGASPSLPAGFADQPVALGNPEGDKGLPVAGRGDKGLRVAGRGVLGLDKALLAAREDPASLGARVAIADEGGSYPPLGLAEALAAAGTAVHYLTADGEIGAETAFLLEQQHLLPRLRALGVDLVTDCGVRGFGGGTVEAVDLPSGRPRRFEGFDTLVLALGRDPRDGLAAQLADLMPEVRVVGDALVPRPTAAVVAEAEKLALDI